MTAELNDALDDIFGSPLRTEAAPVRPIPEAVKAAAYIEKCPACRGTGKFVSWSGRIVGQCFRCKGQGSKSYKSSSEDRATSRAKAADRRVKTAETNVKEFSTEFPAEYTWMLANGMFEFAVNMLTAVSKYGYLTDNQMAAVRRCMARASERKQERQEQAAARTSAIDVTRITLALNTAYKNGKEKPYLFLGDLTFSRAPDGGKNPGAVYVKRGDQYLGKCIGSEFQCTRECDEATKASIVKIAADPYAAAVAHGKPIKDGGTGQCSCCGLTLTNPKSVALGIGPICREKYGW